MEESAPQPYAWGDLHSAVNLLQQWRKEKDTLLPSFQEWVRSLDFMLDRSRSFKAEWRPIKQQFAEQRSPRLRKRRPYASWYPVAWFERVQRLRAGN
jgi:hypothetical protein